MGTNNNQTIKGNARKREGSREGSHARGHISHARGHILYLVFPPFASPRKAQGLASWHGDRLNDILK